MWRYLLRPVLFRMDAEWVHYFAMNSFTLCHSLPFARSILNRMSRVEDSRLHVNFCGIEFSNPVGLAAGFDKDARWFRQLSSLGFSHIEVGTLTGQPQPGNEKKRLFRLPKDQALLNCMGFNNRGSEAARESMEQHVAKGRTNDSVLGINIGLSKVVANELLDELNHQPSGARHDAEFLKPAVDDYLSSFRRMHPFADYFAINVSSPNTPGLRDLQHPKKVGQLIREIRSANDDLEKKGNPSKPILVKIAPDLSEAELDETLEALVNEKVDGLIATNTTISDKNLKTDPQAIQAKRCQCPKPGGGFSGGPLTEVSRKFVADVHKKTQGDLPIIGVGGILTGEDAWNMIAAGASIVQVYTGFIYGGPFIVKQINSYLLDRMESEGISSLSEIVGTAS